MRYGIWCLRSAQSVFGPAEAWSKRNGETEKFDTAEEAETVAETYRNTPNVGYQVRELPEDIGKTGDSFIDSLRNRFNLDIELTGGGCTCLARYVEDGPYLWVTSEHGIDMPTEDSWIVNAYPADWDGDFNALVYEERSDAEHEHDIYGAIEAALLKIEEYA